METTELTDMNRQFNEKLDELASTKGHNTQFFTYVSYAQMIENVKLSMNKTSNKKPEDYQRLRRFDIITTESKERLIVPVKEDNITKFYVYRDEIFQILQNVHLAVGHGGRARMDKELKLHYKNITKEMITTYLKLCKTCEKKRNVAKKAVVTQPISTGELNSRCQVDLIDMQSQKDEEYKFILVCQDHRTKFVQLRALKSKKIEEAANVLLDIFTTFGAPNILQSGTCREFANKLVQKVCDMWPELKMVHGQAKHSVNQEPIDTSHQDIQKMIRSWLVENNTKQWSKGLRFVQLMKNSIYHTSINCSPYEAMFGTKLKVGFKSYFPYEHLNNVHTEEDLEKLLTIESTEETNIASNSAEEEQNNDRFIKQEPIEDLFEQDKDSFIKQEPIEELFEDSEIQLEPALPKKRKYNVCSNFSQSLCEEQH